MIKQEILDALGNTINSLVGGENYYKPTYQLSEIAWKEYADIFKKLGGKYVSKDKGFKFKEDISGIIQKIVDEKDFNFNVLDFYPTPEELVIQCIEALNIPEYGFIGKILEPNGGTGAFISKLPEDCQITTYELDPSLAKNLKAKFPLVEVFNQDFLLVEPEPIYDYVVMNPPFNTETKKNIWMAHINHAKKFLRKGGKLVAIVPGTFIYSSTKEISQFREEMLNHGWYFEHNIEFSTTKVKTVGLVYENIDIEKLEPMSGYPNFSVYNFFLSVDNDPEIIEKILKLSKNYTQKGAEELLSSLVGDLRKMEAWIIHDEKLKSFFCEYIQEYYGN